MKNINEKIIKNHCQISEKSEGNTVWIYKEAIDKIGNELLENEIKLVPLLMDVDFVSKLEVVKDPSHNKKTKHKKIEGISLRQWINEKEHKLDELIDLMIRLTRVVMQIHQKMIIHRNLYPESILVSSGREVHLLDFYFAINRRSDSTAFTGLDAIPGQLSYISPEQTGRMNRNVDSRSDLYSLGIIFYELLGKKVPFKYYLSNELIYAHLALKPEKLHQVATDIPEQLSNLVMRLLQKEPNNRYQSAHGLSVDLEKCLSILLEKGYIEPFELGTADQSEEFRISDKLYGRKTEIEQIVQGYEKAAQGEKVFVLVEGYSGVGKSSLVREIYPVVSQQKGLFLEGKFDQYKRVVPYTAINQALSCLANYFLSEPEEVFEDLKANLSEAVGDYGKVIQDVIPSMSVLLGKSPELPELEARASQSRFEYYFGRLISRVCEKIPLLLFIDDMQWMDMASWSLIRTLLENPDISNFMIVGAYRHNEIDETHPLITARKEIESLDIVLKDIKLKELLLPDVQELLKDSLGEAKNLESLGKIIFGKTLGNPFFTKRLLVSLAESQHIKFNSPEGQFTFEIEKIKELDISDNVVALLMQKFRQLDEKLQGVIALASCIGNYFEADILQLITEKSSEELINILESSISENLIRNTGQAYRFVHDRIQQAAHSLLDDEEQQKIHYEIGQHLLKHIQDWKTDENLLDLVNHLNISKNLITNDEEKVKLAEMNLEAAHRAKNASAFNAGQEFCKEGLQLLPEDAWQSNYRLILELNSELSVLAYMAGDLEEMDCHFNIVLSNAKDAVDTALVTKNKIGYLTSNQRHDEAIDLGLILLERLGLDINSNPGWEEVAVGLQNIVERLENKSLDFTKIKKIDDKLDIWLTAVTDLITGLIPPAYISRPTLCPQLTIEAINLCSKLDYLPVTFPYIETCLACYIAGVLNLPASGFDMCNHAIDLGSIKSYESYKCRALHMTALIILPWNNHISESLDLFVEAHQYGRQTGDIEFAAFASTGYIKHSLYVSKHLEDMVNDCHYYRQFTDSIKFTLQSTWINAYISAAESLMKGDPANSTHWHNKLYDDSIHLKKQIEAKDRLGLLYTHVARLLIASVFRDTKAIAVQCNLAGEYLDSGAGMIDSAIYAYYYGLHLAGIPNRSKEEENALETQIALLTGWSKSAPMNFEHKKNLVRAQQLYSAKDYSEALKNFELAVSGAESNQYTADTALACELMANCYREQGFIQAADLLIIKAIAFYQRWGAYAKLKQLKDLNPTISEQFSVGDFRKEGTSESFDLSSIMLAAEAISREISLDPLLKRLMELSVENAGAQRGVLLLKINEKWYVFAENNNEITKTFKYLPIREYKLACDKIITYVIRKNESLVIADAMEEERFSNDRYIKGNDIHSVLCTPLIDQGKIKGILYLENNLTSNVFTENRVQLLNMFSSMMAMALDKAILYEELENRVIRRTQELEKQKKKAESADKLKSTFLASMSHELRTPLNSIIGFTGILLQKIPGQLNEEQTKQLNMVKESSHHLLALINDVLDVSKIEAGRLELESVPFEINKLILETIQLLKPLANAKNLKLEACVSKDVCTIIGDKRRIQQVLINLVNNAIKFTEEGKIVVQLKVGDNMVETSVIDTGIGIKPEDMDKLFQTFTQVDTGLARVKEGSGLGLAISIKLAEMMGGTITVQSEWGAGSTFTYALPLNKVNN